MPNFNSVTILGRCTKAPELRQAGVNKTPVCDVAVAVNHVTKNQDGSKNETSLFVDVTCWSRLAEIASQYIHTGDAVFFHGRLHMDKWTDKNGTEREKLKIVAENLQLLTGKPNSASPAQPSQSPAMAKLDSARREAPAARPPASGPVDTDPGDDQIPF